MADADLAKLEEKQEAQLVELGRMQVALDSLKRKAGGAAGTVLGKVFPSLPLPLPFSLSLSGFNVPLSSRLFSE